MTTRWQQVVTKTNYPLLPSDSYLKFDISCTAGIAINLRVLSLWNRVPMQKVISFKSTKAGVPNPWATVHNWSMSYLQPDCVSGWLVYARTCAHTVPLVRVLGASRECYRWSRHQSCNGYLGPCTHALLSFLRTIPSISPPPQASNSERLGNSAPKYYFGNSSLQLQYINNTESHSTRAVKAAELQYHYWLEYFRFC